MAQPNTPLTEQQRHLITAMLSSAQEFDGSPVEQSERDKWLAMVDRLSVGEPCACGMCPTFELLVDGEAAPCSSPRTVLSAETSDAMVLLFIDDGKPSYFEVAPTWDTAVQLPTPQQLRF